MSQQDLAEALNVSRQALPAVFMAISGIFVSGGFGTALIRKPDLKEEDLSTAFYYSMAVGIL